ncbi:MAG: agmatine/peptidylarginine deiminase [Pirellulaceae bacterium]
MKPAIETPASLGYRWPAEWEPHAATWVAWPHNRDTWPGKFECIPQQFALLVRTIAEFEPVNVLAGRHGVFEEAKRLVGDLQNVTLWDIPTDDAWCRDHGPTFLAAPAHREPALVNWDYNAWGGKYPPCDNDNAVPQRIAQHAQRRPFMPRIVLEGGAIDGDGQGSLLTTESCLLNRNRNPGKNRDHVEQCLKDFLGVRNVLWLSDTELAGDDTDGHVDQLARFVDANTVVAAIETNPSDVNYATLQGNLRQLRAMSDEQGRALNVVALPMPAPKFCEGRRLPASYVNFYIANGLVVVPQYEDAADEIAVGTLRGLFPTRQIKPLPALDIVWGLGGFHCLTQQEPG